jgi:hypothetical protein
MFCLSSSSHSSVAKKLSAIALSKQSPRLPMDWTRPSLARWAEKPFHRLSADDRHAIEQVLEGLSSKTRSPPPRRLARRLEVSR